LATGDIKRKYGLDPDYNLRRAQALAPAPEPGDILREIKQMELAASRQARMAEQDPIAYEMLVRMMSGETTQPALTPNESFIGGGNPPVSAQQRTSGEAAIMQALQQYAVV
jgi:hypothetical protein